MDAVTLAAANAAAAKKYAALTRRGREQISTVDWPALRPFHAAAADRDNNPCDILLVGDSVGEGATASSWQTRWAQRMLNQLRAQVPATGATGGCGYVPAWYAITSPANQGFIVTGGTSTQGSTNGLGKRSLTLTQAATTMTITRNFTSFDLLFTRGQGTSVTVAIDGAAATTVTTSGTAGVSITWRSPTVTSGPHTVVITGAVGSVAIEGAMFYDGDETKGIRFWDGAHSGYTAALFNAAPTNWAVAISSPVAPSLILVELGLNDYVNVTPAQFQADITALVALMRSKMTHPEKCSIVLMGMYQRTDPSAGGRTNWSAYIDALYALAATDSTLTVLDLTQRMIATGTQDFLGLYSGDQLHPTTKGHALIADIVTRFLLPR